MTNRLRRSPIRFWLALVLLTCGLSLAARGQDRIPIESLSPGKKLFSIGVFSDNKGGHANLTETLKLFRNRINPRFIIGLGDHFNSEGEVRGMEESAAAAYGSTDAFYDIFYPVIGDNEDRIFPNGKGRPGGAFEHGWFERCKIATRDGRILRDSIKKYDSKHGDYYAVLEEKGLRIHLVALYFPDTMGKLFPESLTFGESTCKMIKKEYPKEPMIVFAHNGDWWKRNIRESSPIFEADIIMEASLHQYIIRDKVPGKSLTFNTAQVHRYRRGHVFEIRVFKEGLVLMALEHPKCLMGPIELDEWRKVWVKPFGKKPYPVLDWDEIRRIAPEILPPAKAGFNRERVLLHGFARRHKEMPSLEEIEKELKSKDPETRAVALLGLGYSKDVGKASELLRKHLPGQEDPGIQAYAVIALLRTHPGVAVPLLVDNGKDSMLTRVDLRTVARQKNCPDKARVLTALASGGSGTIADHAIEAMALEFNRKELKGLTPLFIEALENEKNSPTLDRRWVSAATALMKLGPEAKPALPVLTKRIDCRSHDVQRRVIMAIGIIGGPEARKAVPKLKEQLKSPDPLVRRVTTEALRNLGL
ncbi:HEAT repeat domain-containing protein [Planctomycetota bacterium]